MCSGVCCDLQAHHVAVNPTFYFSLQLPPSLRSFPRFFSSQRISGWEGDQWGKLQENTLNPYQNHLKRSCNSLLIAVSIPGVQRWKATRLQPAWAGTAGHLPSPPCPPPQWGLLFKGYKTIKPESRAAAAVHNTQTVSLQAQGCLCLQGSQQGHGIFAGLGATTGKND